MLTAAVSRRQKPGADIGQRLGYPSFGTNLRLCFGSSRYRLAPRQKASPLAAFLLFLLFLAVSMAMTGCQAPAKINNVALSLQTVKKTIASIIPQGVKEESLNGREVTSGYFNLKNWEEDATDKTERAYAKVLILGEGRPYRIDVHVYKEKKSKSGTYNKTGEDKKVTKELVARLKDALADRREDRNIIDDFRPF